MVAQISIAIFFWYSRTLHGEKDLFCVTIKKFWLKLIPYVLDLKNLHNKTISQKNLYNFVKCIGIWNIYITKQFREIIYTKFREILQKKVQWNFAEFCEIKSLSSLFRISRNKKILFRDHPTKTSLIKSIL
jgi:hypothetical protein